MKVNVVNKIGEKVDVVVTEEKDDAVTITIDKKSEKVRLGDLKPGDVFRGKLNCDEYICLGTEKTGIAVITKNVMEELMSFGANATWESSEIRKFLNEWVGSYKLEFGSNNLCPHITSYVALDGTVPEKRSVFQGDRNVLGLLDLDRYRRYRYVLKPIGESWWLSTARTYERGDDTFSECVLYVGETGHVLYQSEVGKAYVRPFLCLNPETMVIPVTE